MRMDGMDAVYAVLGRERNLLHGRVGSSIVCLAMELNRIHSGSKQCLRDVSAYYK